jgi:hypothetical protein
MMICDGSPFRSSGRKVQDDLSARRSSWGLRFYLPDRGVCLKKTSSPSRLKMGMVILMYSVPISEDAR